MKTKTIGAFEAKTHFSEILEKVRGGDVYVVTKRGKPVAQIGPTTISGKHPVFGSAEDSVRIAPSFENPLPDMDEYRH